MAKRLSLLKPNKKTVYLANGKGQEVNYLHISRKLDLEALRKDVKAGATQFKECLEFAENKSSRVVLIDCNSEEEGLMAVSYLAGINNWKEGMHDGYDEEILDEIETEE